MLKKHCQDSLEKNKTDLSKTWKATRSTVNVGRKSKSTPCSLKHTGALLINPVKIAGIFNVLITNKRKKTPSTYLKNKILKFSYFYPTTPDEIIKIIKCFSNNKWSGSNSLLTSVLMNCVDVLSVAIYCLVNRSFTTREFPKICKSYPVIEKKVICLIELIRNYRPILLLFTYNKIFEKSVYKRGYLFLEENNSIFKRHLGFRSCYSFNHTILNFIENIEKYIDNDNYVCNVFIDFEKAFDIADCQILLQKLNHYGIRVLAYKWFRLYLSHQQQFDFISGIFSELMLYADVEYLKDLH